MIKTLATLKNMTEEIESILDEYENLYMPDFNNYDPKVLNQYDGWNNYADFRKFETVEELIYGKCDQLYDKYNSVLNGLRIDADVKNTDASYKIVIECNITGENINSDDGFVKYYNVYKN